LLLSSAIPLLGTMASHRRFNLHVVREVAAVIEETV
jgi:hypothetical protein